MVPHELCTAWGSSSWGLAQSQKKSLCCKADSAKVILAVQLRFVYLLVELRQKLKWRGQPLHTHPAMLGSPLVDHRSLQVAPMGPCIGQVDNILEDPKSLRFCTRKNVRLNSCGDIPSNFDITYQYLDLQHGVPTDTWSRTANAVNKKSQRTADAVPVLGDNLETCWDAESMGWLTTNNYQQFVEATTNKNRRGNDDDDMWMMWMVLMVVVGMMWIVRMKMVMAAVMIWITWIMTVVDRIYTWIGLWWWQIMMNDYDDYACSCDYLDKADDDYIVAAENWRS